MKLIIRGQFTSRHLTKCNCNWCQGHSLDNGLEKVHGIYKTMECNGFVFGDIQQHVIKEELSKYPEQTFFRWITCEFTISNAYKETKVTEVS